MSTLASVLDVDGPAAPPRSNGELVFGAPWESRAFGLAVALHAEGRFDWEDFRRQLIAAIADWEREHDDEASWSYYGCWLTALERVLAEHGLVGTGEVEARAVELGARPHGHDHVDHAHDHDHDHDHDHEDAVHNC
jgi:nitrile hydratase accessory protein